MYKPPSLRASLSFEPFELDSKGPVEHVRYLTLRMESTLHNLAVCTEILLVLPYLPMVAENTASEHELEALEAILLNKSGNVLLHNRFRALFTLKALKTERAVHIISRGLFICRPRVKNQNVTVKRQGLAIPPHCSSMS
jgi:hypothetical protein